MNGETVEDENPRIICDAELADDDAIRSRCDTLAASILAWCESRSIKIAAAESLTGGLVADAFVRIPGASHVFLGSAVTYDIAAKASILGVDAGLLEREGAVHPEVARQMADGTAHLYAQSGYCGVIGLSTTGVAGPGPDGDKPAGLVYVGVSLPPVARAVGDDARGICDAVPSVVRDTVDSNVEHDRGGNSLCKAYELRLHGSRAQVRMLTVLHLLTIVSQLTVYSQE